MKDLYSVLLCICLPLFSFSQNVGIGTTTPQEKLDVNGGIKIGTSSSSNAGAIRYNAGAFEGNNGSSWKAFTQLPSGTLVASAVNPNAALTNAGFTFFSSTYLNSSTTITTTPDSWLSTQSFNAPTGRSSQVAVWTGSKMIVWGGYGTDYLNTGYLYDPVTDGWTPMSASPLSGRNLASIVWTGSVAIIWGGLNASGFLGDGAAYNPSTDTWTKISAVNAPSGRQSHTAVWTGNEMIVWGGYTATGKTNTGARYNPSSDTWTATNTTGAPTPRYIHTAVSTGTQMIIWGGEDTSSKRKNDGAIYTIASDSWTPVTTTNAPVARYAHGAVWTGSRMIIFGGQDGPFLNSGGVYNPVSNTWTATTLTNAPNLRSSFTSVWTGTEMIVWGGVGPGSTNYTYYNDGGRYNPSTNVWTNVGLGNAPTGRSGHTAVLTGNEMIVWGGYNATNSTFNDGGRYILNSESNISTVVPSVLYLFMKN